MTAQHPAPTVSQTAPVHEHGWLTESRHPTSEGTIAYVRCAGCGAHRVDLQAHPILPPAALSRASDATAISRPQAVGERR